MDLFDKIKNTGKSTKEQAILSSISPAMQLIEKWTKDIHAKNEVSKFIEDKYGILFETPDKDMNGIMILITKIEIAESNINPDFVINKMLRFYEEFRIWYKEYLERKGVQNEIQEKTSNN